jgi:hypothetical protein
MPLTAVKQIIYNRSEDIWSEDREEKHPGSEGDGAARPTASLRKLRSQDQVESPVAARYVLAVTRTRVPMEYEGCDNEAAHSTTFESTTSVQAHCGIRCRDKV